MFGDLMVSCQQNAGFLELCVSISRHVEGLGNLAGMAERDSNSYISEP